VQKAAAIAFKIYTSLATSFGRFLFPYKKKDSVLKVTK